MVNLSLNKLQAFKRRPGPVVLIIMDGVGIGKEDESNAFYLAKTPNLDRLSKGSLYTELKAHGAAVGMPSDEDMGNSEVGHNALGAGRVFSQGAALVNNEIESKEIFQSGVWHEMMKRSQMGGALHFIGLLSDGNVHSHIKHLDAMLRQCVRENVKKVRLHILLDGRDVPERSALTYVNQIEKLLAEINQSDFDYAIASGGGRMITTMDRYNADWSIVERGWKAHVLGEAKTYNSAKEAIEAGYQDPKVNDQFLPAFVIKRDGRPIGPIVDGDSVIFFNFRGDRAIEISKAFEEKDFNEFNRVRVPEVLYAGMMEYDGDLYIPKNYLVSPPQIERTVSEYLCSEGIKSLAISETQKFGHVTYFWNGNKSGYVNESLEKYIEIPSDKVPFQQKPEMKAREITDRVLAELNKGGYDFVRINFANGDMVGHTGIMLAAIKAMEVVDESVGRIVEEVCKLQGVCLITADHGNAEEMHSEKKGMKEPKTAHTLNPVPFAIIDPLHEKEYQLSELENPGLSNIAATICNLLGFEKPQDYDDSLIVFLKYE